MHRFESRKSEEAEVPRHAAPAQQMIDEVSKSAQNHHPYSDDSTAIKHLPALTIENGPTEQSVQKGEMPEKSKQQSPNQWQDAITNFVEHVMQSPAEIF